MTKTFADSWAWVFAWFPLVGLVQFVVYYFLGKRVHALHARISAQFPQFECVECMIALDKVQAPGIAMMGQEDLVLIPMLGEQVKIPLKDISRLRLSKGLPGKGLIMKQGFVFDAPGHSGFAFAVSRPVGASWLPRLEKPAQ